MSDDLGPVVWGEPQAEPFLGRQMTRAQTYSEETARRIDGEVKGILKHAYDSAKQILLTNIHILHKVAQSLMDNETLDRAEFARLVEQGGPVKPEGLAWMGA